MERGERGHVGRRRDAQAGATAQAVERWQAGRRQEPRGLEGLGPSGAEAPGHVAVEDTSPALMAGRAAVAGLRGAVVQLRAAVGEFGRQGSTRVRAAASEGVRGTGRRLPHLDRIQASFGRHDVSRVSAHVGGAARDAAARMGARAFATGESVAFSAWPDLHTAAHEAAHVIQQRLGARPVDGVGRSGDSYERNADEVASLVVAGRSAEGALEPLAGHGAVAGAAPVQRSEVATSGGTTTLGLSTPLGGAGGPTRWELATEADVAWMCQDLVGVLDGAIEAAWVEGWDEGSLQGALDLRDELDGLREFSDFDGADLQAVDPGTLEQAASLVDRVDDALQFLARTPRAEPEPEARTPRAEPAAQAGSQGSGGRDLRALTRPIDRIPGVIGAYFEDVGDQGRKLDVEISYVGLLPGLFGALFGESRALIHGPGDVGRLYRDVFHAMGGEVEELTGGVTLSAEIRRRVWDSGLPDGPEAARIAEMAEALPYREAPPTRDIGELERVCDETRAALEAFAAHVAVCSQAFERALGEVGPAFAAGQGDSGTLFRTRGEHVEAVHGAIRSEVIPLVRSRHQEARYRLDAIGELGDAMPVRHWIAERWNPVESPDELLNGGPIAVERLEEMASSDDLDTIARVVSGAVGLVNSEVTCVNSYLEGLQGGAFTAIRILEWTATTCFALLGNLAAAQVGIAAGMAIQGGAAMVGNVVSQTAQGRSIAELDGGEILEAGFMSALAHGSGRVGGELLRDRLSEHVVRALQGRSLVTQADVSLWVQTLPGDVIESTFAAVAEQSPEGITVDGLLRDVAANLILNQLAGRLDMQMPRQGGGRNFSSLTPVR